MEGVIEASVRGGKLDGDAAQFATGEDKDAVGIGLSLLGGFTVVVVDRHTHAGVAIATTSHTDLEQFKFQGSNDNFQLRRQIVCKC